MINYIPNPNNVTNYLLTPYVLCREIGRLLGEDKVEQEISKQIEIAEKVDSLESMKLFFKVFVNNEPVANLPIEGCLLSLQDYSERFIVPMLDQLRPHLR